MFNVSWHDGEPRLIDRGIGHWLTISLPVMSAGRSKYLEVTLIAPKSAAPVSNY